MVAVAEHRRRDGGDVGLVEAVGDDMAARPHLLDLLEQLGRVQRRLGAALGQLLIRVERAQLRQRMVGQQRVAQHGGMRRQPGADRHRAGKGRMRHRAQHEHHLAAIAHHQAGAAAGAVAQPLQDRPAQLDQAQRAQVLEAQAQHGQPQAEGAAVAGALDETHLLQRDEQAEHGAARRAQAARQLRRGVHRLTAAELGQDAQAALQAGHGVAVGIGLGVVSHAAGPGSGVVISASTAAAKAVASST